MKKRLYFFVARYFRFWARIQLRRWQPQIVVITGSSGKTTTLHLVESQLGEKARYSHKANSAFGVPFDILGMGRKTLARSEWIKLVLSAPGKAFKKLHSERLYVVEVDCDRPGEGKFLAELLKPKGVIWLSSTKTHAMNFDKQVEASQHPSVEAAIAYEFGYLVASAHDFAVVNGDNPNIVNQLDRTQAEVTRLSQKMIKEYMPTPQTTTFKFSEPKFEAKLSVLVPQEVGLSVAAAQVLMQKLDEPFNSSFNNFTLPPGRSSVFVGIKDTTLIDGTYNASLDAAQAMLNMFDQLKAHKKWLVMSDILEQGENEQATHEQLAKAIEKIKVDKIITMGPRTKRYTSPMLTKLNLDHVAFETPREVLDYLQSELKGGETILLKGTRFLEGVVEHLLKNPADASKLCRREAVWVKRRRDWQL